MCSAGDAGLVDVLPALSSDLRASPRRRAASTFGADASAPAFQSCLAGAVCRPESFSGGVAPPASPRPDMRGLWRSGSNGVFSCRPTMDAAGPCGRLLGLLADRPQRGTDQHRPQLAAPLHDRDRVTVEELARRPPRTRARCRARASARSCRWSGRRPLRRRSHSSSRPGRADARRPRSPAGGGSDRSPAPPPGRPGR